MPGNQTRREGESRRIPVNRKQRFIQLSFLSCPGRMLVCQQPVGRRAKSERLFYQSGRHKIIEDKQRAILNGEIGIPARQVYPTRADKVCEHKSPCVLFCEIAWSTGLTITRFINGVYRIRII